MIDETPFTQKMEREFHNLTNKRQFVDGLDAIYEQVGKPSKFEQFSCGSGVRVLYNSQTKPTCEVVYNVREFIRLPFGLLITEIAWL